MKFSTFCTECKKTEYSRFLGSHSLSKKTHGVFFEFPNTETVCVWQRCKGTRDINMNADASAHPTLTSTHRSACKLRLKNHTMHILLPNTQSLSLAN